jgi:mRNA interferase RelE/StbE
VKYRIVIDVAAKRELKNLPAHIIRQIGKKIDALADNPFPSKVESIKGQKDLWRIRSGDYRIIYTVRHKELLVLVIHIGDRKEIYRRY